MSIQPQSDILIIGGGPAGLMAAISAGQLSTGIKVTLLESGPRVGRKLCLTGGKRGNFTNQASLRELIQAFEPRGKWLHPALRRFGPEQIRQFFASCGIPSQVEDEGRVFPISQRASDLTDALEEEALQLGAHIITDQRVTSVTQTGNLWLAQTNDGTSYSSRTLILAGGGASFPGTGSDGSCLKLAATLDIPVHAFTPALSPVRYTERQPTEQLTGLSMTAGLSYRHGGKRVKRDVGDLLFTKQGLSGPLILRHSGTWGIAEDRTKRLPNERPFYSVVRETPQVPISLHFLIDESPEELVARMNSARLVHPARQIEHVLELPVPLSLRRLAAQISGAGETPAAQLTKQHMRAFADFLCRWDVTIQVQAIGGAMVSRGGIDLRSVDPQTMMSKTHAGLFAAGEVLDVAGQSGGYNLTAAFATGYLAGESAAQY